MNLFGLLLFCLAVFALIQIRRRIALGRFNWLLARVLVAKELRVTLRSRKAYWFLFLLSLAVSGYFILFWQENALKITFANRAFYSREVFKTLFQVQYIGLGLISALMASTGLSSERENRTLDLLLSAGLSRSQITWGKWMSTIVYQAMLVVSLLPVTALSFQLGGVGTGEYIAASTLTLAAIATGGMIGLAVSSLVPKTIASMLISICIAAIIGGILQGHNYFALYDRAGTHFLLVLPLAWMLGVFGASYLVALNSLSATDSSKITIARPAIRDKLIIQQRREEFPYYLIDPLAAAEPIRDGVNPAYVKEARTNPLGRIDVTIRLCYVGLFISFVLLLGHGLRGSFTDIANMTRLELIFLLLFMPVIASTALSRERDEGTLGLLRATTLSSRQVVFGKFRVSLRFLVALCVSLQVIPVAIYLGMAMSGNALRNYSSLTIPLMAIAQMTPLLIAWASLFAAIGLLCSSLAGRNLTSIVASYAAMLTLVGLPYVIGFLLDLTGGASGSDPMGFRLVVESLEGIRDYAGPLISPFFYFAALNGEKHAFTELRSWPQIAACSAMLLAAAWLLTETATAVMTYRLRRS